MPRTETPETISVCIDCVYFNENGRLEDLSMEANPDATAEQVAKIDAIWPAGTTFTSGCGRDCEDHGVAAYDGDEAAYEDALDERDIDTWFSWSACEECGSTLGGTRTHATAWVPASA